MPKLANVAATLMEHLCTHDWHGYTQGPGRNGDGEGVCNVTVEGKTYSVEQGDRDCSSAVIECWRQALKGTPYEGKLDKATYTGNMRSVFVASGLFEWKPMSYIAQRGDIYLNHVNHTAMCTSAIPDMLAEFNINEFGGIVGGATGDQTGNESRIRAYYDFPWDGILRYNGKADTVEQPKQEAPKQEAPKEEPKQDETAELLGEIKEIVGECRDMLADMEQMKADVAEMRGVLDAVRKAL